MEPARIRASATLAQRVQDIAERLSTQAKAEIYQVLEGIAASGELSSLHRLDPLINDIALQLSDSFKQAVTKRLLPEASKLLGSRSAASASWAGGQAPQTQGAGGLPSGVKQQTHLENDILALGLVPGTGQPLRPDQGPPQDAASAAASSLLLGTAADPSQSPPHQSPSPPPTMSTGSASAGGSATAASHPLESRFAFANDARRSTPLSPPLGRDGSYGGGAAVATAAVDLAPAADPLLFLGLGESGAGMALAAGADASVNGIAVSADSFLFGSSLAGSLSSGGDGSGGGRSTPGTATGFNPAASPSPHAVSRQLGALSLGGTLNGPGASTLGSVRTTAPAVSPPSPNTSTPSPYPALPLTVRPGSSLDPGLATPPVSLAGTEPLRGTSHAVQLHQATTQQQQQQQHGRFSGPGDTPPLTPLGGGGAAAAPVPLFGGAPGPSPGGGGGGSVGGSQQLQQLRQQQEPCTRTGALGGAGETGLLPSGGPTYMSNGNCGGNVAALHHRQQQHLLQHQVQTLMQQQMQQQQHTNHTLSDYQRQQFSLAQQQQQVQQQQLTVGPYDSGSFSPVSVVRIAVTAPPDGPRASYDGRSPSSGFAVTGPEMPYEIQSIYCGSSNASPMDLQQAGLFGDCYASPGPGAFGGGSGSITSGRGIFAQGGNAAASSEYGVYGLAPLGAAGMGGNMGVGGTGVLIDKMRAGSSGGGSGAAIGMLQSGGVGTGTIGAGFGANVSSGAGRAGGSPTVMMAAAGTAVSRPSRSGTASAASAIDSRSSSFSMGPQTAPRHGSGNGGGTAAVQSPYTPQQSSPPASDASGPSSAASVSTSGAGLGVAKGSAAAAVATSAAAAGSVGCDSASSLSMAAKLQQAHLHTPALVASSKPAASPVSAGRGKGGSSGGGGGPKAPADMPGRFRCLPPAVQARIHALTRDNHVVLLKDFDEKVLSKMTLLVDKFGAAECLAMLDRIEEVLKGKAGRLANGPGYLDVSVSTRLDELKQRASGQVTAPEDYARSTLHSRIYAELRDLISRHGFLQWHHFDQGIINMLKKMPNATALERLSELAYHSFKNVDNPKSCIVSIFTTKPKYVSNT